MWIFQLAPKAWQQQAKDDPVSSISITSSGDVPVSGRDTGRSSKIPLVSLDHPGTGTLSTLPGDVRSRKTPGPTLVPSATFLAWAEVPMQPGNVFAGLMVYGLP